jgi:hypothetical protein
MKKIILIFSLLGLLSAGCNNQYKNQEIFNWENPIQLRKLPIGDTTTCQFKKSMAANISKIDPSGGVHDKESVYYTLADEDLGNTVTFTGLNSSHPKIVTNGGQAELVRVNRKQDDIDTTWSPDIMQVVVKSSAGRALVVETYSLDRSIGAIVYTKQGMFLGLESIIEMGYCN